MRSLIFITLSIGYMTSFSASATPPQYNGTETLAYTVTAKLSDNIEIRDYDAAVKVTAIESSQNSAFRQLFKYISGANSVNTQIAMTTPVANESVKVAMTTPVEMTMDAAGKGMQMSFFLPSMYNSNTAPKPTGNGVTLSPVPAKTVAVIRFSGLRSDDKVQQMTTKLRTAISDNGYVITSEPVLMGYDAPWTLWFKRRNEVMFEVQTIQ
jgi:hypothetical protein